MCYATRRTRETVSGRRTRPSPLDMVMNSRRLLKSLLLGAAGLAIFLIIVESGAHLVYRLTHSRALSVSELRNRLYALPENPENLGMGDVFGTPPQLEFQVLHPYLGFVMDPRVQLARNGSVTQPYSDFGFVGEPPATTRNPNEVVVAISGGSVAAGFYYQGARQLAERLQQDPRFKDKTFRFECFALAGYKQPQQLFALNYFLVRGAVFDLWINLDGFNELVLPLSENYPAGIAIEYPRQWQVFARRGLSSNEVELRLAIREAQRRKAQLRAWFRVPVLARSAFWLVLWDSLDARQSDRIARSLQQLQTETAPQTLAPEAAGPVHADYPRNEDETLQRALQTWERSSTQMAALCEANGIAYAHFVQPNQYFPDTKPLNDEEMATAYAEGGYRDAAEKGYPALAAAAAELAADGYPVYDLSKAFALETRTVYRDTCCHLNRLGNDLLADRMAQAILAQLDPEAPGSAPQP